MVSRIRKHMTFVQLKLRIFTTRSYFRANHTRTTLLANFVVMECSIALACEPDGFPVLFHAAEETRREIRPGSQASMAQTSPTVCGFHSSVRRIVAPGSRNAWFSVAERLAILCQKDIAPKQESQKQQNNVTTGSVNQSG